MPSAPGQTTGFNSVSDYLAANQGTLDREAGDINSQIGSELDSAKTAADSVSREAHGGGPDYTTAPGYSGALDQQNKAQQDAELTKSQGGLQQLLAPKHGTPFDAMLLGAHGGFGATQKRADSLHDYLNTTAKANATDPYRGPVDLPRAPADRPMSPPLPSTGDPQTSPLQNPTGMDGTTLPWDVGTPKQQPKRGNPLMGYL